MLLHCSGEDPYSECNRCGGPLINDVSLDHFIRTSKRTQLHSHNASLTFRSSSDNPLIYLLSDLTTCDRCRALLRIGRHPAHQPKTRPSTSGQRCSQNSVKISYTYPPQIL